MWHVQSDPQNIQVIPAIRDQLVTLPDAGFLPAPAEGANVAWFGEASTGTYCGSDFDTVKQHPQDGCTSAHPQMGALTSPSFSLAGRSSAYLVFRGWWEIEAVNADIADLMSVEYSTDGGTTWQSAGFLNPLDPAWGGDHQSYSDNGARTSGSWQSYAVDLSAAAGHSDVRVRFGFDTVDARRNGFRGLLIDGVSIVDPLGAVITDSGGDGSFTDALPIVSVGDPTIDQQTGSQWTVHFNIVLDHTSTRDVSVGWAVHGSSGAMVATGQATVPAGQTQVGVDVPVDGTDAPYTVTIDNPTGGTIQPGGSSTSTPGGSLPVISLDSVGASANGDGTVAVTIGVSISPPAAGTVTVDYTIVGSDGVTVATGTISIPPGATTATTTVNVPADHAPFTVGLSNAQGALLNSNSTSATTSPLAGTSSVTPTSQSPNAQSTGSQLVLGVRIGADLPTLDQNFLLTVVSGTIRYHTPGGKYQTITSGTVKLPFGSVVDATNGHALITVEVDSNHTLQQAEIWEGKAGVFQIGRNPGVTEFQLAGGDYTSCAGSSSKRHGARAAAGTVIRHLWAQAKGSFRTKGRFASATVRGTRWLTEDLCLATRVTVAEGIVGVFDFRRKTTTLVRAGNSITVSALQSARYRSRRGVHAPKLARVGP